MSEFDNDCGYCGAVYGEVSAHPMKDCRDRLADTTAKLRAEVEICRADVGEAAREANYWRRKCEAESEEA